MNAIIETLFEAVCPTTPSPAEQRAIAAADEIVQLAEARLTAEEFDRLWSAVMDVNYVRQQDSFACGLRLGMQLTLAGLEDVSAQGVNPHA